MIHLFIWKIPGSIPVWDFMTRSKPVPSPSLWTRTRTEVMNNLIKADSQIVIQHSDVTL